MLRVTTNHGSFDIELNPELAPKTCANFLEYVNAGHFNDTIFHRVIPGFMVQGGGFTEDMAQKPTRDQIENEADNGLNNETGTIAMARTSDPHSASSQFFINVNDNAFLNHTGKNQNGWGYCVFGKVTNGMDVVMEISMTPTGNRAGHGDVPLTAVIIHSIAVVE